MKIEKGSFVINRNNIISITQLISGGEDTVKYSGLVGYVLDYKDYQHLVKYGDKEIWESPRELVPVLPKEE